MSQRASKSLILLMCCILLVTGCKPIQPFFLFEDGDLSHYKGVATEIEFPDDFTPTLAEVEGALPPLTLRNPETQQIWDLKLEEAVQITLANSRVIRTVNGNASPNALISSPDVAPTVYNPALAETDPIRGVETALSAFDANFTTSAFWEKNDRPVNVGGVAGLIFAPIFEQDLGTFQAQIQKVNATGGTTTIRHNVAYEWNNNPSRVIPSDYNVNIEAEWSQPLLQGAGVEFNRIAGPNAQPGFFFSNGVMVARINTDIALADFEANVRNLVSSVEDAYWQLYFQYRNLDSVLAGRDSALQTWRKVSALYQVGSRGGEAENEAQARDQFYLFRGLVEQALSQLYTTEAQLRYVMGLATTDGRLIRPGEEPTIARVNFDWWDVHSESMVRSVELRRQKFRIKQRELELVAARNFLLPRLDAVGRYRWTGLGDELIDPNGTGFNPSSPTGDLVGSNAWSTLTSGNFQEWQLGFQASVPIGFRRELSAVRNAQLTLARDRAVLQDLELAISHDLSEAIRQLDLSFKLAETNFNRRKAAADEVRAVEVSFDAGVATLDLVLDAQRRLAEAESDFFRAVVDYNLAIKNIELRKGSLLEYDGVFLSEGPWPGKAYFDARLRARERDAGIFLNYGYTRPRVLSKGPYAQISGHPGQMPVDGQIEYEEIPADQPQQVPTPAGAPGEPIMYRGEVPQAQQAGGDPNLGAVGNPSQSDFRWGTLGLAAQGASGAQPMSEGVQQVSHIAPAPHPTNAHEALPNQAAPSANRTAAEWSRPHNEHVVR